MKLDTNQQAFFALLRAGLWEEDVRLLRFGEIDYESVFRLAQEQSVTGILAAGLENVSDTKAPQSLTLQIVGDALQLEIQNKEMNVFISSLFEELKAAGIDALLVKGQGIAQCYERPLWRACGDVDLLLDEENYQKAKTVLAPFAESEAPEVKFRLHKSYDIKGWEVELHGNMRGSFLKRVDRVVDDVQKNIYEHCEFRKWECGETIIPLPPVDNDIIFVFSHILQHFFIEGIGLRQICDWCRLLWTYKLDLDMALLEKRLQEMGVMTEWKAFGSLAVEYLGMPIEAMPFYDSNYKNKGGRALDFILETGSFGYNRHINETYKYPVIVRKLISLCRHTWDGIRYFRMFPMDAIKIWFEMIGTRIYVAIKGE